MLLLAGCNNQEDISVSTAKTLDKDDIKQEVVMDSTNLTNPEGETPAEPVKEDVGAETEIKSDVEEEIKEVSYNETATAKEELQVKRTPPNSIKKEVKDTPIQETSPQEAKKEEQKPVKETVKINQIPKPKVDSDKKPTEQKIEQSTLHTTADLNYREVAGLNTTVIGSIPYGTKLLSNATAKSDGILWNKVNYKGKDVWVSSNYLSKVNPKIKDIAANTKKKSDIDNSKKYNANTIYYQGKAVPYKSGGKKDGQAIIDGLTYASTWGGTQTYSGSDNLNTHFIGHNPGQFKNIHNSESVIVTDSTGKPFKYVKTKLYKVDEFGVGTADGVNYWDRIVGTGGGERIVVQSTEKHPIKWILEMKLQQ